MGKEEEAFPWDVGVFDSHTHPTDTMASISKIPCMKARVLTIMSTRSQDQELVLDTVSKLSAYTGPEDVDPNHKTVPAFGWHPWFSYQMYDDTNITVSPPSKADHYAAVLRPSCKDKAYLDSLPEPRSLSRFLSDTERRLKTSPHALIGEVGCDRAFRLPQAWTEEEKRQRNEGYTEGTREGRKLSPYNVQLAHQKAILKAQLALAGKHRRAVSVHSVQGHGAIIEVLEELWDGQKKEVLSKRQRKRRTSAPGAHDHEESQTNGQQDDSNTPLPYPPRVCLHSYSGPPDPLKQFLHPSNPSEIYFSFSYAINFTGQSSEKAESVIRTVPEDRILIESDYHEAGETTDQYLEWIVRKVCELKGWTLRDGAERLKRNWWGFVFGRRDGEASR